MDDIAILTEQICSGSNDHRIFDIDQKIWIAALEDIIKNSYHQISDKETLHLFWTVNGGHIRNKIRNDSLLLQFLKLSLPKYNGDASILFRGECRFLYEDGKIGFCWTPDIEVAKKFARGLNSIESGGILLKAYAPKSAILSAPNPHSTNQIRENEYTCDPTLLEKIEYLCSFPKTD